MSSTNYDLEINVTYDNAYKHYIPTYEYHFQYYRVQGGLGYWYDAYASFDDGAEERSTKKYWTPGTEDSNLGVAINDPNYYFPIQASGVFSKFYLRNPNRYSVTFTHNNCDLKVLYTVKADFEVQWNSTGFAANQNASFRCSTIQKNTYKQYEWTAATVYYKSSTDANYSSVSGTVSGSWSDVLISTNLTFTDGVTYDVYIEATADDNTTATTPVAQFSTTDADAIVTCISPSGAFTSGNVTFVWSHSTAYGTPQYAYDLQYSNNNGSSWTTVASHKVTQNTSDTATLTDSGVYIWRVRTYNTNDVVGEWAEATFVNQVPANPPTNVQVSTKGRPTVSWVSVSQTAYQVQFLLGDSVVYDSGAVYTSEMNHFVNQYFDDNRSYTVKVRVYNALGEVSDWVATGYQQPTVTDVDFTLVANDGGGATITITPSNDHVKYFVLRNNKPIAQVEHDTYTDVYAIGTTSYSVVGVTSADQSDIQTKTVTVTRPHATIITKDGQVFSINKRVNNAYEIQTSNSAEINKANFIGDSLPTHYPSAMRLKSFSVAMFDEQNIIENLLGTLVYYVDNFNNGGWCMVTAYDKTDNFIKNGQGIYANEVSLKLEVTNYDDSIEYPI